ncbi:hypothetical protein ACQ5SP_11745 [Rhodovulum sp. YNF3179]|uniref:hypothetical protein n=1 Tax=Rhodovulum sp. YNF3179 TaxID=3425127 RepID=UPI003D3301C7
MKSNLKKSVAVIALTAMTAMPIATGVSLLMADTAQAKGNGGQGNGNGGQGNGSSQGRGDADAAERGGPPEGRGQGRAKARGPGAADEESGSRGRGAMASALGYLNAAHASPTGRANAAPNSMPGMLYSYEQTGGVTAVQIAFLNDLKSQIVGDLETGLQDLVEQQQDLEALLSDRVRLAELVGNLEDGEALEPGDDGFAPELDINGDGVLDQRDISEIDDNDLDADGDLDQADLDIFDAYDVDADGDLDADDVAALENLEAAYAALGAIGDGRALTLTADELDELNRLLDLDES